MLPLQLSCNTCQPLPKTAMSKNFKIISWNCNGLRTRLNELRIFANKFNPDIILIQETKIYNVDYFKIPNYSGYLNKNNNTKSQISGGTAIYVRNSVPHIKISLPSLEFMQATAVEISLNKENYLIVSAYVPPQTANNHFYIDIEKIIPLCCNIFIAGDFNAKHQNWGCNKSNTRGNLFSKFINDAYFTIISPPSPTRYSLNSSNIIDFGISRNIDFNIFASTINDMSSDHLPVNFYCHTNANLPLPSPKMKLNYEDFKNNLILDTSLYQNINSAADLDNYVATYTKNIQNAVDKSSTIIPNNNNGSPPAHIRRLITRRNRARKTWQNTRSPQDKNLFNNLNNKIKSELAKLRQESWKDYLTNASTQDSSIWKIIKKFTGKKHHVPPLKVNNKIHYDNEDKANIIAGNLENQFQNNLYSSSELNYKIGLATRTFYGDSNFDNYDPAQPTDVLETIKSLKNKKSPGIDKIGNKIIKNLPINYIFFLTIIINSMFKLCYFPKEWKIAAVIPILKAGKSTYDPNSYRPISLLPSISKIVENIILRRIMSHCETNNIILNEQFGFRPRHSTTQQLTRFVEFIYEGKTKKLFTTAVFLDIAKAFDKVWTEALIYKLIQLNLPPYLVKLIDSYLHNRKFLVKISDSKSSLHPISSGVPQGSKLGPLLFILFINDIPKFDNTFLALYADDTAIAAQAKTKQVSTQILNNYLTILMTWFNKWKIAINEDKSQAIYFSQSNQAPPPIFINNIPINYCKEVTYLGVKIDKSLTWKKHIDFTVIKFRNAKRLIYPLISEKSHLNLNNKLLIYKSILRPIIAYASPVFAGAAQMHLKRLESLQCDIIKIITKLPWYCRYKTIISNLNIPSVHKFLFIASEKFFATTKDHLNPLINNLPIYDSHPCINNKRPRAILWNFKPN